VGGKIIRDELEATYVTSSIPLQRIRQEQVAKHETGPDVPLWARRGARPGSDEQPPAAAEPAQQRPRTAAVPMTPPVVPPISDEPAASALGERGPETGAQPKQPSVPGATASVLLPGATGPVRIRPTTAPVRVSPITAPVQTRPVTGATPTAPQAAPIWFRSDTGPVLLPGEHAPWRAAPVAPPADEERSDSRSVFFAAPVPAQRAWSLDPEQDEPQQPGEPPVAAAPIEPERRPEPRQEFVRQEPVRQESAREEPADTGRTAVPVVPSTVTRTAPPPADIDDTGDPDGLLRRLGRHRTPPLPDHLDFVTGLNLRTPRPADDDEVGPSS
jgi:hypothetical protein